MKVKEEGEKAGLKLNIQKTKIMASGLITSWQIDGETMATVIDFIFVGSKITAVGETSSHLILYCLLLFLLSIPPSIKVFSNESTLCMRWPKCWSFSFSISSSNEYSGLISFRTDWFDLLAVQGTLKSLLNTTVQKHQFFGTQLSSQSNSHIYT